MTGTHKSRDFLGVALAVLLLAGCSGRALTPFESPSAPSGPTPASSSLASEGAWEWFIEGLETVEMEWVAEVMGEDPEESPATMAEAATTMAPFAGWVSDRLAQKLATDGTPPDNLRFKVNQLTEAAKSAEQAGVRAGKACESPPTQACSSAFWEAYDAWNDLAAQINAEYAG